MISKYKNVLNVYFSLEKFCLKVQEENNKILNNIIKLDDFEYAEYLLKK